MIKYFVIKYIRDTSSSVEMLKWYMLIFRNAEGVHGQRKVGNPWIISTRASRLLRKCHENDTIAC